MIYKKIEIKSEADLPKEEGEYLVHFKSLRLTYDGYDKSEYDITTWMTYVDWYLLPQTEEEYLRDELQMFGRYFNEQGETYIAKSDIEKYLKTREP